MIKYINASDLYKNININVKTCPDISYETIQ